MSRRGSILQDYGGRFEPMTFEGQLTGARIAASATENRAQQETAKQTAKQKEGKDATDYITGLKVDGTGINDIDAQNSAELLRVQNEMIRMATPIEQGGEGKSYNDIRVYGMRVLPKIDNTSRIAKNYKAQIDKDAIDLEKTYGAGFDRDAYYNQAYKKLSDDLLERDDKGKIKGYKDPNLVPQNRNYSGEIESDPESLGTVFKTSGSFQKGLEQTIKIPLKGSGTYTDKFGKKVKRKPLGDGTIYDEPIINADGGQTGWRLKGEDVPLGTNPDGSLIIEEVMPVEQFSVMVDTPSKRKDFDIYVKGKLDESGVNVGKLDGRAKDVLERKFAIDYLRKTNAHGSSFYLEDEVKEAPAPKNITNNNIRVGGAPVPVMDIVTPVRDYFKANPNTTVRYTGKDGKDKTVKYPYAPISVFNNEVTDPVIEKAKQRGYDASNIYYKKDGNNTWVMGTLNAQKVNPETDVALFKLDKFSNVSGNKPQGVKSKNKALTAAQEGEANRSGKATAKTFNVINPNTGEVIMKGVDEAAANKAKAKGYKVQ